MGNMEQGDNHEFTPEQLKWRAEHKDQTGTPANEFMAMPDGSVENMDNMSAAEKAALNQSAAEAEKDLQ